MREQACKEFQPVPSIYKDCVTKIKDSGLNLINRIPPFTSIKSTVYRKRNKVAKVNKLFHDNPIDVEIPEEFRECILADFIDSKTRIIVFCTPQSMEYVKRVNIFFCDGTFKSVAFTSFSQLYSIHGDIGSSIDSTNIIPLIYVLMSDKSERSYVCLFSMLQSRLPYMKPKQFTLDYEVAASNALKKVYPGIEIKGCYFHFTHNVWKQAKKFKLTKSKTSKRIIALSGILPLLPPNLVDEGWQYIIHDVPDLTNIGKFKQYFQKQWLENTNFRQTWSVFGQRHRTTNSLESWHKELNKKMTKKGPGIVNLLTILLKNDFHKITNKRTKESILRDEFIMCSQIMLTNGELSVGHFLERVR